MVKGVSYGFYEMWISNHPLLGSFYASHYTPTLWADCLNILGPAKIRIFKDGGDDYSFIQMLWAAFFFHQGGEEEIKGGGKGCKCIVRHDSALAG